MLKETIDQLGESLTGLASAPKIDATEQGWLSWSHLHPGASRAQYNAELQKHWKGPRHAAGGIVSRPELALIGEKPEAIIPLDDMHQVVARIMREEGDANIGMDSGHRSIFGLWEGASGMEGWAFKELAKLPASARMGRAGQDIAMRAWMSMARGSGIEGIHSAGMAEMILADIQHRGGTFGRDRATHRNVADLIREMGGIDSITRMNEADAINKYTQLRRSVWTDTGNAATDPAHRLGRERAFALANVGRGVGGMLTDVDAKGLVSGSRRGGAPITNNTTMGDVHVQAGMGYEDIADAVSDAISDQMEDLLEGLQEIMDVNAARSAAV